MTKSLCITLIIVIAAAPFMFRSAIQDHVISVPSTTAPNKKEDIYVKKGDAILLDLVGSCRDLLKISEY